MCCIEDCFLRNNGERTLIIDPGVGDQPYKRLFTNSERLDVHVAVYAPTLTGFLRSVARIISCVGFLFCEGCTKEIQPASTDPKDPAQSSSAQIASEERGISGKAGRTFPRPAGLTAFALIRTYTISGIWELSSLGGLFNLRNANTRNKFRPADSGVIPSADSVSFAIALLCWRNFAFIHSRCLK